MPAPFLSLPSPFPEHPGTLRLLEPPDADGEAIRRQLLAGTYRRPFLLDDGVTRGLLFDTDYLQSSMRVAAPDALDLVYSHYMMAFVLFHTQPRRIALLGLGGGSLAKFCHRRLPQVDFTAVEFDPDVIAFRDAFRIPPDGERFRVVEADAAVYLDQAGAPFDVILMDAFDGRDLGHSVVQPGFYATLRKRLAAKGVLVANITGEAEARRAHFELLREAFGDNLLAVCVDGGSNHLVFSFRDSAFEPRWKWISSQAAAMQARFGLDFPKIAGELRRAGERGWEQVL